MPRFQFPWQQFFVVWCSCGLAVIVAGCSRPQPPVIPQDTAVDLYSLYTAFDNASVALGRGPKDLAELKKHAPPGKNFDELLISPRDGQPYVLVWNISTRAIPDSEVPPLLVYEKVGKDGKFNALTTMSTVQLTQEELDKHLAATPGAGKK